jgi:hypothetical protein
VNRLLNALPMVAIALLPVAVAAAASPTPSPSLETVLAKPPADFNELTTSGTFAGAFDADGYAKTAAPSNASAVASTLQRDGFVAGYGRTWVQRSAVHVLVEVAMAFTGGDGAKKWLTQSEVADKADPNYQHSDSITGISPYYGAHFVYKSNNTFGDGFAFVKGNDFFLLVAVSRTDDVLNLASTQSKAQFDSAPASTIPSSQWPENANTSQSTAYNIGRAIGFVFVLAVVVGIILAAVFLVLRSRRRTTMPVMPAYAAPAAAVQMSPDGNSWWDGQVWRDAASEAPPGAQRSSDGSLWWDGSNWRPVPQPQPPS